MTVIDTVPKTTVTVPQFLVGKPNGKLDPAILRAPDGSTSLSKKMFEPVSYAMQALHLASKGIADRSVGRYRTYDQQVSLFLSRYVTYNTGSSSKVWNGTTYWKRSGVAMAAVPGTSNHGRGLADDVAEERTGDGVTDSMSDNQLIWMRDNAPRFGFGLETHSERWHWHWIGGNTLSQAVVNTLYGAGINVPDMTKYGFSVPKPNSTPVPAPPPATNLIVDAPPATPFALSKGGAVDANRTRWLQQIMNERWNAGLVVDGVFSATTDTAVRAMQSKLRITSDGVYGAQSAMALSLFLKA